MIIVKYGKSEKCVYYKLIGYLFQEIWSFIQHLFFLKG
jgi:hypothetical protein